MRLSLSCICIAFLSCFTSRGQVYSFIPYTPKDGLVNSRVKAAYQDSKGRMYFITYGGLSIYDGNRFLNYTQSNGLANNIVNDVYEMAPDSVLIATNTQQLNAWINGRLVTLKTADGFCPTINKFFKSKEGVLYTAADEGLFIFSNNKFTRLSLFFSNLNSEIRFIGAIAEYGKYLLMSTWEPSEKAKLVLFEKEQHKVLAIDTENNVLGFTKSSQANEILITTAADGLKITDSIAIKNGVIKLDDFLTPGAETGEAGASFDKENKLWLYGKASIAMPLTDNNYQVITSANGLPVNNILNVFIDRENIKWILTDGSGVLKLVDTRVSIINHFPSGIKISVNAMDYDSSGLWFYNQGSGKIFNYNNGKFSGQDHRMHIMGLGMVIKANNFFCYDMQKIYRMKKKGAGLTEPELICNLNDTTLAPGKAVVDNHNYFHVNIWGKNNSAVLSISPLGKNFFYPLKSYVDEIAPDKNNFLWVISRTSPLECYEIKPGRDSCLQFIHDYRKELPGIIARSITIDNNGNIIIGSRDKGIYILTMKGATLLSVQNISSADGLTDNFIYALACDKFNNIWVGSQNGLDIIHQKGKSYYVENITRNNNIFETVISIKTNYEGNGFAKCSQGNILEINNKISYLLPPQPDLFISSVLINGKPSAFSTDSLQLLHNQNSISFSVAAPSFFDEHSILYSYWLEGSNNKSWSAASNQSVFNFLNLAPASYTLHVRAVFPANKYPSRELSYFFIIKQAWWQTWFFKIAVLLIIFGMLAAIIRFYYSQRLEKERAALEKKRAVEIERTRIATDMHDDLGAGLSRIKFLSETIGLKKQQKIPIEDDIIKIREYSHEMIEKMGEIVWALNEKNDTLSDLLSYTRYYAIEYLSQNGIKCVFQLPEDYREKYVTGEFRRNIFLTIKEALHNVVKHAAATSVTITILVDKEMKIIIADDGTGFNEKDIRLFSNGLFNMRKRMADINGAISIESNKGTVLTIAAPV